MPQILTANRLLLGEVVYWNERLGWVSRLEDAQILADSEAALIRASEAVRNQEVVAPYLFKVRLEDGRAVPAQVREAVRAAGPTVRTDLGKQAA